MEREQCVDLAPGTEVMIDGESDVLVPQPSDDPHDPLNWKRSWKAMCIATSTVISITQGFGPLALAPMFGEYVKAFDSNLHDVVKFTGVCILVLGFSNFIWYQHLLLEPDEGPSDGSSLGFRSARLSVDGQF